MFNGHRSVWEGDSVLGMMVLNATALWQFKNGLNDHSFVNFTTKKTKKKPQEKKYISFRNVWLAQPNQ